MSRTVAVVLGAVGALGGTYAGLPYLSDGGQCVGLTERVVQCHLNQQYLPFVSAITIGMVVALLLGSMAVRLKERATGERVNARKELKRKKRAHDIDDPFLQLAAWGAAPKKKGKKLVLAEAKVPKPEPKRVGASEPTPTTRSAKSGSRGRPVPQPRRAG